MYPYSEAFPHSLKLKRSPGRLFLVNEASDRHGRVTHVIHYDEAKLLFTE